MILFKKLWKHSGWCIIYDYVDLTLSIEDLLDFQHASVSVSVYDGCRPVPVFDIHPARHMYLYSIIQFSQINISIVIGVCYV
jgi:hypothetical protein